MGKIVECRNDDVTTPERLRCVAQRGLHVIAPKHREMRHNVAENRSLAPKMTPMETKAGGKAMEDWLKNIAGLRGCSIHEVLEALRMEILKHVHETPGTPSKDATRMGPWQRGKRFQGSGLGTSS